MTCGQRMLIGIAGLVVAAGSVSTAESVATIVTDGEITQGLSRRIATDDPAVASSILIATQHGVVTLTGRKMTPGDILVVMGDATRSPGVVRVESELTLL